MPDRKAQVPSCSQQGVVNGDSSLPHTLPDLSGQQGARDQTQPPINERQPHRGGADQDDGCTGVLGNHSDRIDRPYHEGSSRHRVAGDQNQAHLHRKRQERPQPTARRCTLLCREARDPRIE